MTMKKVSVLLLLTVALASFAFAIEGIGDFEAGVEFALDNVTSANGGKAAVAIEPSIGFSRHFGGFGLSAKLGDVLWIDTRSDADDKIGDEFYFGINPSYSLAVGPGELEFSLGFQVYFPLAKGKLHPDDYGTDLEDLFFRIDPVIGYRFDAGFARLGFEVGTDKPNTIQISKYYGDAHDKYGLGRIPLAFQAMINFPFGLGIRLNPVFGIRTVDGADDTGFDKFIFDISYGITGQITAGVETSIPTVEDGIKNGGLEISPYGRFRFGAIGGFVRVLIMCVGADEEVMFKPMIGVSYSF
jgi:hypothetical protein